MATLLVELTVGDFEGWKARRDALADVRAEYGERRAEVYRVADEPNRVVVLMEWASLEAARAFSESEAFLAGGWTRRTSSRRRCGSSSGWRKHGRSPRRVGTDVRVDSWARRPAGRRRCRRPTRHSG